MEIERKFLTKEIPFSLEQYRFAKISQSYISRLEKKIIGRLKKEMNKMI